MMVIGDYPFVGRRDEMLKIRAAAERAHRGQAQFVVVEGLSGVGKTGLIGRALDSFQGWTEAGMVLSPHHREIPGALYKGLMSSKDETARTDSADEIAAAFLRWSKNLDQPMVITIGELQHADELSAETLWQSLSMMVQAPVMVVMSVAPGPRTEIRRISQLAQISPQGTYLQLPPLTRDDVEEYLTACTGFSLNRDVAERVHCATDGYPRLVQAVGAWLQSTPVGRRGIDQAVRYALAKDDLIHVQAQLEVSLEGVGAQTRKVLEALAVAEKPVTKRQLECVLGEEISPGELIGTGLVRWDDAAFGYALEHRAAGRGLLSRLSYEQRRDIHLALADELEERDELGHRVAAAQLDPDSADVEVLHEKLMAAGYEAARAGDIGEGFDLVRLAARLRPDRSTLAKLGLMAVPTGRSRDLAEFEEAVRNLPVCAARSALLAIIRVHQANPQAAAQELEKRTDLGEDEHGLLLYAQTLSDVCADLLRLGGEAHVSGMLDRTIEAIEEHRERLRSQRAKQLSSGEEIEPAWTLGYTTSLHALLTVWRAAEGLNLKGTWAGLQDFSGLIENLEKYPGTEQQRAQLRSMRGIRLAQRSEHHEALGELAPLTSLGLTDPYSLHARSQTAILLFNAGKWHAAQEVAEAAAGEALLEDENGASLFAYAVSCLVPAARGEFRKIQPVVEQLEEAPLTGPLVKSALYAVRAWAAVAEEDHGAAAQHLLAARNASSGWWLVGLEPLLLLARELHYSNWSEMLPGIVRSAAQDVPSLVGSHLSVIDYLRGFESWAQDEPERAMDCFVRALRFFDRQPPLRPSQAAGEGGGFRLFRALLGVDMACLFAEHPQLLRRHRAVVLEMVVWAASVFQSCGSEVLFARAAALMNEVRPKVFEETSSPVEERVLKSKPETPFGAPAPEIRGDAPPLTEVMDQLSFREQEIAFAVAEGNTNREVAEELVISVRTVEYHVGNILQKLSLGSRKELRQLLRAVSAGQTG
ncbi:hypothetical protein GCM10028800_12220 [Nesterenkonia populi]